MLSLVLTCIGSLTHALCFFLAARELERIGNSPNGPRRFPRQWRLFHVILLTSFVGALAFPALSLVGF